MLLRKAKLLARDVGSVVIEVEEGRVPHVRPLESFLLSALVPSLALIASSLTPAVFLMS